MQDADKQHLYTDIGQFEPLLPSPTGELEDIAYELTQRSANLANQLAAPTLEGIRELLRVTNSYYSNLIEGNNTHPIDVERAMRADYSNDPAKRDRQQESVIHIDVQKKIESVLAENPKTEVSNGEFLAGSTESFTSRCLRAFAGSKAMVASASGSRPESSERGWLPSENMYRPSRNRYRRFCIGSPKRTTPVSCTVQRNLSHSQPRITG